MTLFVIFERSWCIRRRFMLDISKKITIVKLFTILRTYQRYIGFRSIQDGSAGSRLSNMLYHFESFSSFHFDVLYFCRLSF